MSPRGYGNPLNPPKSMDAFAVKKNAFHDQQILVVNINDPILPWQDRELLKQIGQRLYGEKRR